MLSYRSNIRCHDPLALRFRLGLGLDPGLLFRHCICDSFTHITRLRIGFDARTRRWWRLQGKECQLDYPELRGAFANAHKESFGKGSEDIVGQNLTTFAPPHIIDGSNSPVSYSAAEYWKERQECLMVACIEVYTRTCFRFGCRRGRQGIQGTIGYNDSYLAVSMAHNWSTSMPGSELRQKHSWLYMYRSTFPWTCICCLL